MLRRILIILGAFVALLPYLGLPRSWDNILFTFCGLTIVVLLVLGKRPSSREVREIREGTMRNSSPVVTQPHSPTPVPVSRGVSQPPSLEKSSPVTSPLRKAHDTPSRSEPRRIARAASSRTAPVAHSSRTESPAPLDVVIPPSVRPTPPPVTRTGESSKQLSDSSSFEERKSAPPRRQRPKSAEDFLKGDTNTPSTP